MTAEDIARDYPFLSTEAQATALTIINTSAPLMVVFADEKAFPNDQIRKSFCQQLAQLRNQAIQMLGTA